MDTNKKLSGSQNRKRRAETEAKTQKDREAAAKFFKPRTYRAEAGTNVPTSPSSSTSIQITEARHEGQDDNQREMEPEPEGRVLFA